MSGIYFKINRLIIFVVALFISAIAYGSNCNISLPEETNIPDALPNNKERTWVGSTDFAAYVPKNGVWTGLGANHKYRNKWWWWRSDYETGSELGPEITITAKRLDKSVPSLENSNARDGYYPGWNNILVFMEFPSSGCWEVTGKVHDNELKFIFKVE